MQKKLDCIVPTIFTNPMEKMIIICIFALLMLLGIGIVFAAADTNSFWKDGYCIQKTALTPAVGATKIRAKVDGKWQEFALVGFPEAFWDWNRNRRLEYLQVFREMLGGNATGRPNLAGPHNGMVATYGAARKDSKFKLNNAVKGMGFLPKAHLLEAMIKELEDSMDDDSAKKLSLLEKWYMDAENVFEADRLVSLELYSEPGFATQTFINQMLNPACVTVFLDIPTYKLKQIVRLLDPQNPALSDYEKLVVKYVNLIHTYFHGAYPRDCIAVVYYNTEVYDSSPGRKDARGTKLSP